MQNLDTARVLPDRGAAPDGTDAAVPQCVHAQIQARSDSRQPSSTSAFWPFPDLALLELDGWSDRARTGLLDGLVRLHTKLLIDQRLVTLPLSLQISLSPSAATLGDLARVHGLSVHAQAIFVGAFAVDQHKHELEPGNTTFRWEFAYSLYLSVRIAAVEGRQNPGEAERVEVMAVLIQFEDAGLLTIRGHDLLAWAREQDGDR